MNGAAAFDAVIPSGEEVVQWVGAPSWEERCVASLAAVAQRGHHGAITLFEISSQADPARDDRRRRQTSRAAINAMAVEFSDGQRPDTYTLLPNAFEDAVAAVLGLPIISSGVGVLDVTCFTKLMTFAAGCAFARRPDSYRWLLAYTPAEGYGPLLAEGATLGDPAVIKVTDVAHPGAGMRGLFIAGFTAERAVMAFNKVAPASGLILIGSLAERPDYEQIALRRNAIQRGVLHATAGQGWQEKVVDLRASAIVVAECERQVTLARMRGERVVAYPFGPKPLIFFSALALTRSYADGVLVVYPATTRYDIRSADGTGRTLWYPLSLPRIAGPSRAAAISAA